jgi:hypothetical protein
MKIFSLVLCGFLATSFAAQADDVALLHLKVGKDKRLVRLRSSFTKATHP